MKKLSWKLILHLRYPILIKIWLLFVFVNIFLEFKVICLFAETPGKINSLVPCLGRQDYCNFLILSPFKNPSITKNYLWMSDFCEFVLLSSFSLSNIDLKKILWQSPNNKKIQILNIPLRTEENDLFVSKIMKFE